MSCNLSEEKFLIEFENSFKTKEDFWNKILEDIDGHTPEENLPARYVNNPLVIKLIKKSPYLLNI